MQTKKGMDFEIGKYYKIHHEKYNDTNIVRCEKCKDIGLPLIRVMEFIQGKDPRDLMYFGTGVNKRVSNKITDHLGLDYELNQLVLGNINVSLPDDWDWEESSEDEFNKMCSEINWDFYSEPYKTEVRDAIEKGQ